MIVQQHLAPAGHPWEREDCVDGAARHRTHAATMTPIGVHRGHERDFVAARAGDLVAGSFCRRGGQPIVQVLSSFFFAAGKRTLLRIRR
jgi:hypothetical protein